MNNSKSFDVVVDENLSYMIMVGIWNVISQLRHLRKESKK
jgi:hypothetical protein